MDTKPHTLTLTGYGPPRTVSVQTDQYVHGGLAVQLVDESDGMPFATVSIKVPDVTLKDDEFVFKTYSENEGLLEQLLAAGAVERTGRSVPIGPICRLR